MVLFLPCMCKKHNITYNSFFSLIDVFFIIWYHLNKRFRYKWRWFHAKKDLYFTYLKEIEPYIPLTDDEFINAYNLLKNGSESKKNMQKIKYINPT